MRDRYFVMGSATVGTDKTGATVISATTVRPAIYEITIGCAATPADQTTDFRVKRFTADGTGTAWTPTALDPISPTARATSKVNYSAEPTYTASAEIWQQSIYQRAPYRWVAMDGRELVAPATAASGLGLKSASGTGTAVHQMNVFWVE